MFYLYALLIVTPLVALYAVFVRTVDRFEPEPWWALAASFVWGALGAVVLAIIGSVILQIPVSAVVSDAEAANAIGATFIAPITEESAKGLGVIVIFVIGHLIFHDFDGPLDGLIYGGFIGLGFTLTEDTLYIGGAGTQEGWGGFFTLTLLRTVLGGLGHAMYTGMIGFGWGMVVISRSWVGKVWWPCFGFAVGMLLHGAHNALPSYLGQVGGLMSVAIDFVYLAAWFVLVVILVVREKGVILRQLDNEIGASLRDREEHRLLGSYFWRTLRGWALTFSSGWSIARATRRRWRAIVELALVKEKRSHDPDRQALSEAERRARAEIAYWVSRGAL